MHLDNKKRFIFVLNRFFYPLIIVYLAIEMVYGVVLQLVILLPGFKPLMYEPGLIPESDTPITLIFTFG